MCVCRMSVGKVCLIHIQNDVHRHIPPGFCNLAFSQNSHKVKDFPQLQLLVAVSLSAIFLGRKPAEPWNFCIICDLILLNSIRIPAANSVTFGRNNSVILEGPFKSVCVSPPHTHTQTRIKTACLGLPALKVVLNKIFTV